MQTANIIVKKWNQGHAKNDSLEMSRLKTRQMT